MRVLLIGAISPPIVNKISSGCLPFGVMALSTYLKKQGIKTAVVSTAFPDAAGQICAELSNVGLVGISSMSGPYLNYAIVTARNIRKAWPGLPIVWGGPHASLLDDSIINAGLGDFIIRGAGEKPLHKLILSLEGFSSLSSVPGLTYCEKGMLKRNQRDSAFDIEELPAIDYSLAESYTSLLRDEFFYFTSRGCLFNCSFCVSSELYGRHWYAKSEDKVIFELREAYEKYKFASVFFMDDNVFLDAERLRNILRGLNRCGVHFSWSGFCRADLLQRIDDSLITELKDMGLKYISIGAESGSQKTLDRLNKGISVEQIKQSAIKLKKFDIQSDFSFMGGIPQETPSDFMQTLSLIKWIRGINRSASVRLFRFIPYPGMSIIDRCEGILQHLPNNIYGWCGVTYQDTVFPWVPKTIDRILTVIATASHYGFKPKITSLKTFLLAVLAYVTNLRIKYGLYGFPLEGIIVSRINKNLAARILEDFSVKLLKHLAIEKAV